jgi:hypothetical protein
MSTMNIVTPAHVSDAVKQLRGWVTLAATIVGLACATQMLVFGFAAYTEVRWEEMKPVGAAQPLRVVGSAPAATPAATPVPAQANANPLSPVEPAGKPAVGASNAPIRGAIAYSQGEPPARKTVEPNKVKSAADLWLHRASDLAAAMGLVAVICLFALTMLGAVVAGGGGIMGVERAVTSAVWSMILCLLCVPWSRALPGLGVQGVFASYTDMIWAVDARNVGSGASVSFGLAMQWIAAPACGVLAAMGVAIWFRAGVERGIVVSGPSELERAVVREAEMIQKRGVAASTPKAMGALSMAMGGSAPASGGGPTKPSRGAAPGTLSAVEKALEEKELAGASASSAPARPVARGKMSGSIADEDFRRPI